MAEHDKKSFAREYCRARRIPYYFRGDSLYICGRYVLYNVYNHDYDELLRLIDNEVVYLYGIFKEKHTLRSDNL